MEKEILFHNNKEVFTNLDLLNSLRLIKADECDVLYIHTSLNFGTPNTNIKKNDLLQLILDTILELKVSTIIFPTYTFSFCNGEDFDINNSKTTMGLLNEYVRKMPNTIRSLDPLMSNVLLGEHSEFVNNIGKNSVGLNSTFDLLHKTRLKVKFLFLGPKIGDCFTHMHYIESEQNVPYRYNKDFTGKIINGNNNYTDTYSLFVRYNNVLANCGSYIYENMMIEKNIAQKEKFANSYLTIVESQEAYNAYLYFLKISPNFYIKDIFDINKCDTSFNVSKMVAL
jgi:aminoglycoside 3-N-acetyltransferase